MFADNSFQIIIGAIDKTKEAFNAVKNNSEALTKKMSELGSKMQSVGKGMTAGLTLPLVGVGIAAGKLSMDFEASMSNISTLIDTSVESMTDMKNEVLELSKRTPLALADLTSALYDVRSAGINAGEAMNVLESSAKLATAGLGTTKEATDILTSAINAFGLDAKESERAANTFFVAVKAGKTTVSELAQGFGAVAPLANALGIGFEDLVGTAAAMTTSGLKASIAYTQQKAVMSGLLKPTAEMIEMIEKAGIVNIRASMETDGFVATLRKLYDAADGNQGMIAKMFGSVEALNAVMMLMGKTGDNAIQIIGEMTAREMVLNEAFEKQTKTVAAQVTMIKNNLNVAMIKLGDVILPIVIPLVEKLTSFVSGLSDKFSKLSPSIQNMIVVTLGLVAVAGPLLMILGTILSALPVIGAAFAFLISPIGLVIAIIGLLVLAGYLLYTGWDTIKENLMMIWEIIKTNFMTQITAIYNFGLLWFSKIKGAVIKVFTDIKDFFVSFWTGINSIWESAISWLMKRIKPFLDAYERIKAGTMWVAEKTGAAISSVMGVVKGTKQYGGYIPETGLYNLHQGEYVLPKNKTGGITINISGNTFMSDREAALKIFDMVADKLKMQFNF